MNDAVCTSRSGRIAFISGGAVLLVGLFAWLVNAPCLAPPLGVTAVLCVQNPGHPACSPRSIVLGHALGIASGLSAAALCGVLGASSALAGPFTLGHALASGLAITLTVLTTVWFRCPHPPAGATTLVASLGLMTVERGAPAFMVGTLATVAILRVMARRRPAMSVQSA